MISAAAAASSETEYDLYFVPPEGSGFHVQNPNHGVRVASDGIGWASTGQDRRRPLSEIAAIRLSIESFGGGAGVFGSCRISFQDGSHLTVRGGSGSGNQSAPQAALYGDFLKRLHQCLGAQQRGSIDFVRGYRSGKYGVLVVWTIMVGSSGVIGLVVLATGKVSGLFYMMLSAVMVLPLIKMLRADAPRPYDPDNIPPELVP